MKQYNASFKDSDAKEWTVKLTMSKVLKFCGENNLRIEQVSPKSLNADLLAKLCFIGIAHHTESKGWEFDEFMDKALAGECYRLAMEATAMAIVNFTLPRIPDAQRVLLMKQMDESGEENEQTEQPESP